MRRRDFITLVGGAAAISPLAALAQQSDPPPPPPPPSPPPARRLGVLTSGFPEANAQGQARVAALKLGLVEHGWIEGSNLEVTYRWGGNDTKQISDYAAELVASTPDVIFAGPAAALAEVQRATSSIPIVFAQISDPVGAGFVASVAHPGGNITGIALSVFAIGARWLELLKQIAPSVTRALVLYKSADPNAPASLNATGFLPSIEAAGGSLGIDVLAQSVSDDGAEIEPTINKFGAEPNGGLIAIPGAIIASQRDLIASLAIQNHLPSVSAFRYYALAGGLVSYWFDDVDPYRRSASYIDLIFKGAKPGNLPVQEANKFQLIINTKTAKALGVTIPDMLLAAADKVIE